MGNNQLESLDDIFDGKFLRIPDYQRGYEKSFEDDTDEVWNGHK